MAERLSQVEERIDSVGQLSSVVAAIRGIAAARLREGEERLDGVRAYTAAVGLAIGEALALLTNGHDAATGSAPAGKALVIALCSEQGFAGAYNSRILGTAGRLARSQAAELFVVGDHGLMVAGERGLEVGWSVPMAVHIEETTDLANRLADALYDRVRSGVTRATIVHATPDSSGSQPIVEKPLIPFDFSRFPAARKGEPPILTLPPKTLLAQLAEEYVFAELCEAAVLAYAAESEARMRAMISAHDNVDKRLNELKALARRTRQEETTSEVVELAGGVEASRSERGG
jgi:F-type H+-transporting ATPase subunit gamma